MKHFLAKTDSNSLCLFFHTTNCHIIDLVALLNRLYTGCYKWEDELPLFDNLSGVVHTSSEGVGINKRSISYPDNYEGYEYICIQFDLIK